MEFLGIGPLELAFIILLAIIIFGPKDIVKASKTVGKSLNKFIRSDTWKTINQTTRELKDLPIRLMRETGLDDLENSVKADPAKPDPAHPESVGTPFMPDLPLGSIKPPAAPTDPDPGDGSAKNGPAG
jgi:Sec-independent protein translocase protein TatA